MSTVVRDERGQYANAEREYRRAVQQQQDAMIIIFRQAGVDPRPIFWSHSGHLSLNALAAVINAAVGHQRIPEIHPADFDLEGQ